MPMCAPAGTLHVVHGDDGGIEAERFRQRRAQRKHALAMRPHRQMAVAILSQSAGWRDRSMREIAAAIGGLITSCDEGRSSDNQTRGYVNTRINATLDSKILNH